jgi:hypothetical protein
MNTKRKSRCSMGNDFFYGLYFLLRTVVLVKCHDGFNTH